MIRLAIVGDAEFAKPYVDIADRVPEAKVVIVAGADSSQAAAIGAQLVGEGLDRLLADHASEFDALILGTSDPAQSIGLAASRGKHVLVPGNPASSVPELDAVTTACRDAGICLMSGNPARFRPTLRSVHASIEAGKLGAPGLLRIHRWEAGDPSSGSLFEGLTREIDLACWLFGSQPQLVFALGRGFGAESEEIDYAQLHLGFEQDGMALIDVNRRLPDGDDYFSLSVIGSTGAAYADDHHNMQLVYGGGAPRARQTTEGRIACLNQLKEFVSAVEEKRTPSVAPTDSRTALRVVEAVKESIDTGEAVQLAS